MKWILLLLLAGGIAFGLWKYSDEIFTAIEGGDSTEETDDNEEESATETVALENDNNSPDKPGRGAPSKTVTGTAVEDVIAKRYPMPDFKPLEELVGNWTNIPANAFPRDIKLKVKSKYFAAGGAASSTAPAGAASVALSSSGGNLIIAPRRDTKFRGQVAIDGTDFKESLTKAYDSYKARQRKKVLAQRELARSRGVEEVTEVAAVASKGKYTTGKDMKPLSDKFTKDKSLIGPMPTRAEDGTVTVMVNSIKSGDVTEIQLDKITHWGSVRYEVVGNKPYWTGTVRYKTTSLFGTFDTEAMALIRNGAVTQWIYTGSMEEVP